MQIAATTEQVLLEIHYINQYFALDNRHRSGKNIYWKSGTRKATPFHRRGPLREPLFFCLPVWHNICPVYSTLYMRLYIGNNRKRVVKNAAQNTEK